MTTTSEESTLSTGSEWLRNGVVTNDKLCLSRRTHLHLSWARLPKSWLAAYRPGICLPEDTIVCDQEDGPEPYAQAVDDPPPDNSRSRRMAPVGSSRPGASSGGFFHRRAVAPSTRPRPGEDA
jgi:hypothetical protein